MGAVIFTFEVVKKFFLESFLSLTLPTDGILSQSTSAFLLGVSRLSAPRQTGPGESLRSKAFESSFGDIFQREGVPAFPP